MQIFVMGHFVLAQSPYRFR